nr:hypothetical protein Q903MT_gene6078 [Picea sitchensis]
MLTSVIHPPCLFACHLDLQLTTLQLRVLLHPDAQNKVTNSNDDYCICYSNSDDEANDTDWNAGEL